MSKFEIVSGVEGKSLYIDETRVAGPKPWGGGTIVDAFTTDERYVPERTCRNIKAETPENNFNEMGFFECSVCGAQFGWDDCMNIAGMNYCPRCGAKVMDE